MLNSNTYHDRVVPLPASEELGANILRDLATRSKPHHVSVAIERGSGTIGGRGPTMRRRGPRL